MGPWHHGQEIDDGSALGALALRQRYGAVFPAEHSAAVSRTVSEGRRAQGGRGAGDRRLRRGTNNWLRLPAWPAGCAEWLRGEADAALFQRRAEAELSRHRSPAMRRTTNTFPIRRSRCRFVPRPIQPVGYGNGMTWPDWLVDDQRRGIGRGPMCWRSRRMC